MKPKLVVSEAERPDPPGLTASRFRSLIGSSPFESLQVRLMQAVLACSVRDYRHSSKADSRTDALAA